MKIHKYYGGSDFKPFSLVIEVETEEEESMLVNLCTDLRMGPKSSTTRSHFRSELERILDR